MLRLATERRLHLDQPVSELVPVVRFTNPWRATDPVLVRHLLDHTAGLEDARFWQVFSQKPGPDDSLHTAIGRAPLVIRTRPGSRMSYSNLGYTLLGMVIEAVTGERYERWLDRNLLAPVGMTQSTFGFVSQETDSTLAMGHFEQGVTQVAVASRLRPAGQFTTTASDMAVFARFLLSEGRVGDLQLIEPGLIRAMGHPVGTEAREAGLETGYALGMTTRDRFGVVGLCHSGNTIGYRAMLCLFPEEGKAFFISHNADVEGAAYARFDSLMIRSLGVSARSPVEPADGVDLTPWTGTYVMAPSRFQSFAWVDRVLGFATVSDGVTRLRFTPVGGVERTLVPAGDALLRAGDRTVPSHAVLTTERGRRVITDGIQTWERISRAELVAWWTSLILGLLGLAYLFGLALVRMVRRSLSTRDAEFAPCLATLSLLLPLPFLFRQSFLALGDLTVASALLALVTLALPLSMIFGLWRFSRIRGRRARLPAVAMVAVLQLCLVLAWWDLLPFRLWVV